MSIIGLKTSIRYANRTTLLHGASAPRVSQPGTVSVRTVFLPPKKRTRDPSKKVVERKQRNKEDTTYTDQILAKQSKELELKIKEMQEFTMNLKAQIKKNKESEAEKQIKDISKPIEQDSGDVDVIYDEILGDSNDNLLLPDSKSNTDNVAVSLFDQPAKGIVLPQIMLNKIGDNVVHIVNKDKPNWDAIILDLAKNKGGLQGVVKKDIYQFMGQIAMGKISSGSLELLHEMLKENGIAFKNFAYDFFMKQYAQLGSLLMVESFYKQALADGVKPSKYMYSYLIKVYSKHKNLKKINQTLNLMHQNKVEPGLVIYSNVLNLCVNMKDSNQAQEIFQMMKFRSTQTKPDIQAYNSMILLATNDNDIYKALDLYRELEDAKLSPSLFTLNCLARCCSKNKEFFVHGWRFINEINERRLTPNVRTFEAMLRLAAKDGDLELARALYITIFKMRQDVRIPTAGHEALVYLLMAYRDYKIGYRPSMLDFPEGVAIRRNALNLVDFLGLHQDVDFDLTESREKNQSPPFLPLKTLIHPKQIIAESNAIWSFHLLSDPGNTLNLPNLITFLRIPIEHGDKQEFLRRFEELTYPSPEIKFSNLETAEEFKQSLEYEIEEDVEPESNELVQVEEDLPEAIKISKSLKLKMERSSEIYITYLSAGNRFRDLDICEKAWIERGNYRRVKKFKSLNSFDKARQDYRFAKEMVLTFTQMGLLEDAVKIVRSTKYQFGWKFYTLKPLYAALSEIGDDRSMIAIQDICNSRKGHDLPEMPKDHKH